MAWILVSWTLDEGEDVSGSTTVFSTNYSPPISFLMLGKRRRALGTTRIDSAEHESRPSNKRGRRGQKGKGPPCDPVHGLK
jgi:hypothetical protein